MTSAFFIGFFGFLEVILICASVLRSSQRVSLVVSVSVFDACFEEDVIMDFCMVMMSELWK